MKKTLLTLIVASAATVASAQFSAGFTAGTVMTGNPTAIPTRTAAIASRGFNAPVMKEEGSATSSLDFAYCGQAAQAFAYNRAGQVGVAMEITPAVGKQYAGSRVKGILIHDGATKGKSDTTAPIRLFCSTKLDAEPFMTDSVELKLTTSFEGDSYTEYPLAEPFEMTPGKPFFVGFTMDNAKPGEWCPFVVDGNVSTKDPGLYLGEPSGDDLRWTKYTTAFGNACIKLRLEGEDFPVDMASMADFVLSSTVIVDEPATVQMLITNDATNNIESIGVTYTIDGGMEHKLTVPVKPAISMKQSGVVSFPVTFDEQNANAELIVLIHEVNGKPNGSTGINGYRYTVTAIEEGNGYPKATVIEEYTGTWCGWCPRGIVAMDELYKLHDDGSFIGVAVHGGSMNATSDPMSCTNYSNQISDMVGGGAPSALVNRDMQYLGIINPTSNTFVQAYNYINSCPSVVKIDVTKLEETTRQTTVEATATFACDIDNANYRVSYTTLEDHVGPYDQTNYYASGEYGPMGGWESKPALAETYYDHVARWNRKFEGVQGIIPSTINAGEPIDISNYFIISSVKNKANASYLIMVINDNTGRIENAIKIPAGWTPGLGGIESVEADATGAPAQYFD
ncbi:MAG: hypothetical protein K2M97_07280, partial [Muribaculaceae bacterium]|nr:hypothetical protein [Muribaculaceae bacterium]